jgi:hypothetical protein
MLHQNTVPLGEFKQYVCRVVKYVHIYIYTLGDPTIPGIFGPLKYMKYVSLQNKFNIKFLCEM